MERSRDDKHPAAAEPLMFRPRRAARSGRPARFRSAGMDRSGVTRESRFNSAIDDLARKARASGRRSSDELSLPPRTRFGCYTLRYNFALAPVAQWIEHAPPKGGVAGSIPARGRSEEHTSELQSLAYLVCRLLLEKKK